MTLFFQYIYISISNLSTVSVSKITPRNLLFQLTKHLHIVHENMNESVPDNIYICPSLLQNEWMNQSINQSISYLALLQNEWMNQSINQSQQHLWWYNISVAITDWMNEWKNEWINWWMESEWMDGWIEWTVLTHYVWSRDQTESIGEQKQVLKYKNNNNNNNNNIGYLSAIPSLLWRSSKQLQKHGGGGMEDAIT